MIEGKDNKTDVPFNMTDNAATTTTHNTQQTTYKHQELFEKVPSSRAFNVKVRVQMFQVCLSILSYTFATFSPLACIAIFKSLSDELETSLKVHAVFKITVQDVLSSALFAIHVFGWSKIWFHFNIFITARELPNQQELHLFFCLPRCIGSSSSLLIFGHCSEEAGNVELHYLLMAVSQVQYSRHLLNQHTTIYLLDPFSPWHLLPYLFDH